MSIDMRAEAKAIRVLVNAPGWMMPQSSRCPESYYEQRRELRRYLLDLADRLESGPAYFRAAEPLARNAPGQIRISGRNVVVLRRRAVETVPG